MEFFTTLWYNIGLAGKIIKTLNTTPYPSPGKVKPM